MPFINGTPGDDTLPGTIDHDLINGLQGNDSITADAGDDLVRPGTGDDVADGGSGIDRVSYASAGTDVVTGVTVSLALQGTWQNTIGGGTDYLIGFEHLTGTRYDDMLTGDGGDNWLWGGIDPATGVAGDDTISGEGGNDLIDIGPGNSTADGGTGADTLTFFGDDLGVPTGIIFDLSLQGTVQATSFGNVYATNFENVSGTVHYDTIRGDSADNVIAGDVGDDSLFGGAGGDTLYGDGRIYIDSNGTGYSGPITVFQDVSVSFGLTDGNDFIEGGAGDDLIYGGGGNDWAGYEHASGAVQVFLGNSGNGSSDGADGMDALFSIENIMGSQFDDTLYGNDLDNIIEGLNGNDLIFGRGGNDTMRGGAGDDFLRGSEGADVMDGSFGWDRVSSFVVAPTSGITFDLNIQDGSAQDTGQGMDILLGIEHASGTVLNDTLTGNSGDNWLWDGSDGDETVNSSGDDAISSGDGNDLVEVGAGNDTLDGGAGTDSWSLLGGHSEISSAGVTVSLALQGAAQDTEQGMMTATGFENLSGSLHDDELTGDGNDNVLAGDTGHDRLVGADGNDTLYGDGRIHVDNHGTGGSGPITSWADVRTLDPLLEGGNDWLEGGLGDDTLDGGGGTDWASYVNAAGSVTVVLGNISGSASGADGNDLLLNIENVVGSSFDDLLLGNSGDNWLDGYAGNDSLRGRDGNDTVFGNDGNDFLNGGAGDDVVDGGNGFDRATYYTGATAGVTVDLNLQGVAQNTGQGMDTLVGIENVSGTAFGDTLTGDGGDNWLWGSPATLADLSISPDNNDTLDGGGGNDLLTVGIGNHSLTGGTGTDTVSFTENGNPEPALTISLELQGVAQATGAGSWTLNGIENLSGGIANDHLTGDGNDNVLAGDQGDDSLFGGAGNDTLYGDGRIAIDYAGGPGTSGPIATFADGAIDNPGFVSGNDILDGGAGNDILNGGAGIDTASFASWTEGVTVILTNVGGGNAFNADESEVDTLVGIENLIGSAFNDWLRGNNGANVLDGGAGGDALFALGGDDTLIGGDGDDFLRGSDGADTLNGGNGWDRVSSFVVAPTTGITFNLNIQGVAQDTGQGMDTLIGIEHASGTVLSDTLIGDSGSNWLWNGSDGIAGGGTGDDNVDGGGGDDLVEVGSGNHTLAGGTGTDALSFLGGRVEISSAGVTYSLALQGAAQATEQGSMVTSGFENVSGSLFDDVLTGDAVDNVLAGDLGSDSLSGGDGNDALYGDGRIWVDTSGGVGGSGPIALFAQVDDEPGFNEGDPDFTSGNDTLDGGKGDDNLYGGRGDDTLTGGQNADRFIIEADSGDDIITDFKSVDTIVFDPASGIDEFSDLTLTAAPGNSTLITWGTDDSILVQGVKPNQLGASDFEFGSSAAAVSSIAGFGGSPGHDYSIGLEHYTGFHGALAISISQEIF